MEKQAYFFIDDVIWLFRDLARQRPAKLFDNPFMAMLKKAHDDFGLTLQLHLFYRTDFFYGDDEFTLSEMPDCYKDEFKAISPWFKMSFHSKQEFPDYPYVNASYEDAKKGYLSIINEIRRFAGDECVSPADVIHWGTMSKEGCKALADCGLKYVSPSVGPVSEFNGDDSVLPYGHAARLRQNRKPETRLFRRDTRDERIVSSVCGYNTIDIKDFGPLYGKNKTVYDPETGINFFRMYNAQCLNLCTPDEIEAELRSLADKGLQYICAGTHEQYFYPDYFAHRPDYAEGVYRYAKVLNELGYRFISTDEIGDAN